MKNLQCFLTAFVMGMMMIVGYNLLLLLTNNLAEMSQDKVELLLLQIVILVKFISASLVVMPAEINIKQVLTGYVTADLIFTFPLFWHKSLFSFSAETVIAQVVLLIIYAIAERGTSGKTAPVREWKTANGLIFQGLNDSYEKSERANKRKDSSQQARFAWIDN